MFSEYLIIIISYETQTTIGYGGRHPTEKCPSAVFAVMVQSVLSTIIDAFAIGWIIAKISRPKKRAEVKIIKRKSMSLTNYSNKFLTISEV